MINNDSDWLGEDAGLGPAIRAGLGILLAQGNWTWWHHPSAASMIMRNAVTASGVVEWGGDPAVLEASEWLSLDVALEVANAFKTVIARRGGDLRIKILRNVCSWDATLSMHDIADDLGRAFARERIFSEWPADRRSRRPAASTKQGVCITSSAILAETTGSLIKSLPTARWSVSTRPATIAVATLADFLQQPFSSELLIVLDRSRAAVIPHIDTIRASTGAQCAIFLRSDQPNVERWLETFGAGIAAQLPVDQAMAEANKLVERHAIFLASTQAFMVHSNRTFFPSATRSTAQAEQQNSTSPINSAKISKQARPRTQRPPNLEIEAVRMESSPPSVRVIDARVEHSGLPITTFPLIGVVAIHIRIQPVTPLKLATPVFPEQNLDWTGDQKVLQVHLIEAGAKPISVPILLPRSGASTPAVFLYTIPSDRMIDLSFVVSERTCVLQTARMRGHAGTAIEFFVEALNSSVEHNKNEFDVSLVIQDGMDGEPSATILTDDGIHLGDYEYQDMMKVRDDLLAQLATCLEPEAPFNVSLYNLANSGKIMLDALKDFAPNWPTTMRRVQLTTPTNEHFPLEYLYEGVLPNNEDAHLCSNRAACLTSGVAVPNCEIRAARQQLCPMGFAGVTAVIERRTWDRNMDKKLWLKQATDLARRDRISDLRRALFAASDSADEFENNEVPSTFSITRNADVEALIKGWRRHSWEEWEQSIIALNPRLLVLVPHIDNKHLYIGDKKKLGLGAIGRPHVGNSGPIVIVIGCNSAIGFSASTGLPAILLRGGAKVVIGALTSVLGRFANIAAADLTTKLLAAASDQASITIGELINRMRREFLAKDNAFGMVLVAFGDADVYLGEPSA
ncbi:hypothetical protein [Janthinobacterium sp. YR213]|uniref:hypothetical protein n=1 Tax=Janthinobacterium sp. YR213 TaxID=1881027 RepID=UPI00088A5D7F|nr:hypothetical protein [Janthinobacterium sp. YR213]SDG75831.1 hypothetical protein SAMN05428968_0733 [Janthinobacterium sp. YR213]